MTFFEPCRYFWSSQTYLVVDEKVPKTAGFFFKQSCRLSPSTFSNSELHPLGAFFSKGRTGVNKMRRRQGIVFFLKNN